MTDLRAFMLHRWTLSLWLVAAALFVRAIVPAGYMVDAQATTLSFTICSDATGAMSTHEITIPDDGKADAANADKPCSFAGSAQPALSGADAPLLALALAFILLLGFVRRPFPPLLSVHHLRPPSQGPPMLLS